MIKGYAFPYQQSADPILPDPALMVWQPEENQPRIEPPPPLNQGFFAFVRDIAGAALNTATLSATMTGVATMARLASLARTFSAAMTGVATMLRLASFFRDFSAAMTGVATLVEDVLTALQEITLSATATGVATLQRFLAAFRTLSATVTGSAALARLATFFRDFSATVTGAATITATFVTALAEITLAATCTGVATILATVTRFVAPFAGHGGMGMLDRAQTRWQRRASTWRRRR